MKNANMKRIALLLLLSVVVGCGGSPPIATPDAMPQSRAIATHAERDGSRMLPGAAREYKVTGPLVYVTNYTEHADVTVYAARTKNPGPIAVISNNISAPSGDCIDGHGTLYVTNQPPSGPGWVSEYSLGKTTAAKIITDGISTPAFCAIDRSGNLWVTNIGGPTVTEYLPGSKKPHTVITKGMLYPVGIAIDSSGNLYVANRPVSGSPSIKVYPPGAKAPTRTITDGVTFPVGIGVDSEGTLYATNASASANNVEEYLPGQGQPYRAVTKGLDVPVAVVLNTKGWLYVANFGNSNNVVEFPPGSVTPSRRHINKDVYAPEGVAYYPPLLP
jgi:serine/threonine protein kinase, bacterial